MTFEEFILEEGFNPEYDEDKLHIHNMKAAWNAALEKAAKVVGRCEYMSACNMDIAEEIRALKEINHD